MDSGITIHLDDSRQFKRGNPTIQVTPVLRGVFLQITIQEWPPASVEFFMPDELIRLCHDVSAVRRFCGAQCVMQVKDGATSVISRTAVKECEVQRGQ